MNISVVYVDIKSVEHRSIFDALFTEYALTLSVDIERTMVTQLFELPYFHGFICFDDQIPIGFAVCFESYSTYRAKKVLNIHDFMICGDYRGQGVGKTLLQGIDQYCCENDVLKITLEVDNDNIVARKLYNSCDYEDCNIVQKGLLHWQKYLV